MFNKNKKNNKGFTLVELLVVIAIIGILAVAAVPTLFSQVEKGKVSSLESEISTIKSATIAKYSDDTTTVTTTVKTGVEVETLLVNEIEGLSKKYGGTYTIRLGIAGDGGDITTKDIVLEIALDNGTEFSSTAIDKIEKDLGLNDKGTNGSIVASKLVYKLIDIN